MDGEPYVATQSFTPEPQVLALFTEFERREAEGTLDGLHAWAEQTIGWPTAKVDSCIRWWRKPRRVDEMADPVKRTCRKFVSGMESRTWVDQYPSVYAWTETEFGWSADDTDVALAEFAQIQIENHGLIECPHCGMPIPVATGAGESK